MGRAEKFIELLSGMPLTEEERIRYFTKCLQFISDLLEKECPMKKLAPLFH